jgi:hypothetical protein
MVSAVLHIYSMEEDKRQFNEHRQTLLITIGAAVSNFRTRYNLFNGLGFLLETQSLQRSVERDHFSLREPI